MKRTTPPSRKLATPSHLLCEYLANPIGIETPQPRFSWRLQSERRGQGQAAWQVLVASSPESLARNVGDAWDSGKVECRQSVNNVYAGREPRSRERLFWKVRCWDEDGRPTPFSRPAWFEMGLLHPGDWQGQWIGAGNDEIPAPLLRKEFDLQGKVASARASICGLGYCELYLNGRKVGDHVLDPNWTDYDDREMRDLGYPFDDKTSKRVLYVTYDVTKHLKPKRNAVGVMLGNGWFNQRSRNIEGKLWYGAPRVLLQLDVVYADGSARKSVVTDSSWKCCAGPITFNNVYFGETWDARLEQEGWAEAGFDDSGWGPAAVAKPPAGKLHSQTAPPDKVMRLSAGRAIKPVRMTNPSPGVWVFDMGRNFSGWARVSLRGPRGTKVTLRFAEEIKPDGTLDFLSAGGDEQIQTDAFFLKGSGIETWEPRFTWHCFRYVELTGCPDKPRPGTVVGRLVHSAVAKTGSFSCSNKLLNQIQKNYVWTQLSNMHGGVPSDCPHRERLGYTGDGQITAQAAIYNLDMAQFYTKWVDDIFDSQNKETGFVPHTAPFYGGGGGPGWGCACVIVPWAVYLNYGDRRILHDNYAGMKHWMSYLAAKADNFIIDKEEPGSWCLGDWSAVEELKLPPPLVNTFWYIYVARMMADIARVLGREDDACAYARTAEEAARAFNERFLDRSAGCYSIGWQGADVFPLALGIVPADSERGVVQHLVDTIMVRNGGHLDTGIFGTPLLLDVLVRCGRGDVAATIMNKRTFPSYGYMIERGATTIWENWRWENGTHCHPMFGSVSAWFFAMLAGIRPDARAAGYRAIIIEPHPLPGLTSAKASIDTPRGTVSVNWAIRRGRFSLAATIPVTSTATVHLPKAGAGDATVSEGGRVFRKQGRTIRAIAGVTGIAESQDRIVVGIGSGDYDFEVRD